MEWLHKAHGPCAAGAALVARDREADATKMDESVLWVLQGEYGVLPRRSSSPLPALLGTADATTCLIVLLATPHAVGCAHVDSEQTAEALRHVLADMAACRSGPARAAETPVDAWLLGSYSDGADSVANVAGALAALHAAPGFSVALRGVCVLGAATRSAAPSAATAGGWGTAPGFPLCTAAAIRVAVPARASEGAAAAAAAGGAGGAAACKGEAATATLRGDAAGAEEGGPGPSMGEVEAFRCVSGAPAVSPLSPARMCRSLCPPLSDASLYDAASCGVAASADSPTLLPITRVAAGDRDAGPAWSLVVLPAVPRPGDGFPTAEACRALSDAALLRMSTSPEHEPPSFCPAFRLALAFAAGGDASAVAAFGRLPAGPRVLRPRQAAGGRLEFDS